MTDSANPATAAQTAQVTTIRNSMLALHKILLETERVRYERVNGRVNDMFQLLNLTINDPAFAWLRPMSTFIVEIDEQMESKDNPFTSAQATAVVKEVRQMLTPSQTGGDFQRNYHWALQESPEAVVAHSAIVKLLA